MLISVPSEESKIFEYYFETVWNMESDFNWSENYRTQCMISEILKECGYSSTTSFMMLSRSHDIIYDR